MSIELTARAARAQNESAESTSNTAEIADDRTKFRSSGAVPAVQEGSGGGATSASDRAFGDPHYKKSAEFSRFEGYHRKLDYSMLTAEQKQMAAEIHHHQQSAIDGLDDGRPEFADRAGMASVATYFNESVSAYYGDGKYDPAWLHEHDPSMFTFLESVTQQRHDEREREQK